VDAFQDYNLVRAQLDGIPLQALAGLEIEMRQLHRLSGDQTVQVVPQASGIHGSQGLEVKLPVFILGGVFPVIEIIVHLQRERVMPCDNSWTAALGKGGLPR
jgi:hypothetical protein